MEAFGRPHHDRAAGAVSAHDSAHRRGEVPGRPGDGHRTERRDAGKALYRAQRHIPVTTVHSPWPYAMPAGLSRAKCSPQLPRRPG